MESLPALDDTEDAVSFPTRLSEDAARVIEGHVVVACSMVRLASLVASHVALGVIPRK